VHSTECSTVPAQRTPFRNRRSLTDVHLEPVPRLEWSLATEAHPPALEANAPASLRCSWIHRAPEDQVLSLFRKLNGSARQLPGPWWLPALDRGEIPSRAAAFEIEDEIHALLATRPGWVFVPWANVGETGYWEYGPSDREPMKMPTTVALTDQHPGWVHAVAAHADTAPPPFPVNRAAGLRVVLPLIESW
jgi:hypothetical protein